MSKWRNMELLPTANLEASYEVEAGVSGNDIVHDDSGNDRHITAASNPPAATANVRNGQPAIYWGGTQNPLKYTGSLTAQHIFLTAAYDGATFAGNEGLASALTALWFAIGGGAGLAKFYPLDVSVEPYVYRFNGTEYPSSNMVAPMGLAQVGLIEILFDTPGIIDGFQIGNDRALDRKWKGWFFRGAVYSAAQSAVNVARIHLLNNLQYGLWRNGLPLRFPDPELTGIRYFHFDDEPKRWGDVTEDFTYEDGGKDFFTKSDDAPRFWNLEFNLAKATHTEARAKTLIFDEFWNQAQKKNPFIFVDKYGETHTGVRIADYSRAHDTYKSWRKNIRFRLVKYP